MKKQYLYLSTAPARSLSEVADSAVSSDGIVEKESVTETIEGGDAGDGDSDSGGLIDTKTGEDMTPEQILEAIDTIADHLESRRPKPAGVTIKNIFFPLSSLLAVPMVAMSLVTLILVIKKR